MFDERTNGCGNHFPRMGFVLAFRVVAVLTVGTCNERGN